MLGLQTSCSVSVEREIFLSRPTSSDGEGGPPAFLCILVSTASRTLEHLRGSLGKAVVYVFFMCMMKVIRLTMSIDMLYAHAICVSIPFGLRAFPPAHTTIAGYNKSVKARSDYDSS